MDEETLDYNNIQQSQQTLDTVQVLDPSQNLSDSSLFSGYTLWVIIGVLLILSPFIIFGSVKLKRRFF